MKRQPKLPTFNWGETETGAMVHVYSTKGRGVRRAICCGLDRGEIVKARAEPDRRYKLMCTRCAGLKMREHEVKSLCQSDYDSLPKKYRTR